MDPQDVVDPPNAQALSVQNVLGLRVGTHSYFRLDGFHNIDLLC
jgi:hypothetical protein